jgi:PAS domain S-box-containing protein
MSARAKSPAAPTRPTTAAQGGRRAARRLATKLLIGDFAPPEGPLSHRGLVRRAWPFALAGAVTAIMFVFPTTKVTDHVPLYAAAGLTVALIAAVILLPWHSLPEWAQAVVPFAFLGVIALLRESIGGAAGFAVLVMLPVLWLALYGAAWQLVTAIVLSTFVFLAPVLIIGAPDYPASGLGRLALWPVTAAVIGGSTYRLVAAERARTSFVNGLLSAATEQSIIATDPNGLITVFNRGAERMFGYPAEDMVGKTTSLMLHDPDEVAARAAELGVAPGVEVFIAQARRGRAETREWTYIRRDGSRLRVSLSIAPYYDAIGELRGVVKIGTDITERAAAEQVKDEFVALISHELRTPLSSIIGYLEVLFDDATGPLTQRQRRFLEVVDRNARRQLRLVSDLLFVSQVDAGRLRLHIDDVDVAELAKAAIEAAQPRAKAGDVTLQLEADDATTLRGDPDRLGQVIDNLLTNAIKFTPRDGVVDVRVTGNTDTVAIEVSDTGVGIPAAEQRQLFTRFFRASTATGRAIPGIGLGLTIVKAIVDAHRGTVSVTSAEGNGTTFRIYLPRSVQ